MVETKIIRMKKQFLEDKDCEVTKFPFSMQQVVDAYFVHEVKRI